MHKHLCDRRASALQVLHRPPAPSVPPIPASISSNTSTGACGARRRVRDRFSSASITRLTAAAARGDLLERSRPACPRVSALSAARLCPPPAGRSSRPARGLTWTLETNIERGSCQSRALAKPLADARGERRHRSLPVMRRSAQRPPAELRPRCDRFGELRLLGTARARPRRSSAPSRPLPGTAQRGASTSAIVPACLRSSRANSARRTSTSSRRSAAPSAARRASSRHSSAARPPQVLGLVAERRAAARTIGASPHDRSTAAASELWVRQPPRRAARTTPEPAPASGTIAPRRPSAAALRAAPRAWRRRSRSRAELGRLLLASRIGRFDLVELEPPAGRAHALASVRRARRARSASRRSSARDTVVHGCADPRSRELRAATRRRYASSTSSCDGRRASACGARAGRRTRAVCAACASRRSATVAARPHT